MKVCKYMTKVTSDGAKIVSGTIYDRLSRIEVHIALVTGEIVELGLKYAES